MTEKKYIDRDALINDFESDLIIRMFDNLKGTPRPRAIDIADVIKRIEDFSTEDIVKVVRCKDCKFYGNGDCSVQSVRNMYPNDYCSYGERRSDSNA